MVMMFNLITIFAQIEKTYAFNQEELFPKSTNPKSLTTVITKTIHNCKALIINIFVLAGQEVYLKIFTAW